ncbi:hypothetical protein C8J57DRAFT_32549 [Mycena rebaudengoi]|nr:hypothetical protein C8J57DRAFT_32549 [Mycena rebaudengoi]
MGVCSGFCDARAFKQRAYIPAQNSTEFPFNWTTGSLVVHGQLGVRRDPSQIPRYDATPIQFPDMSTYCQASTCTEQNATSTSTYIHTVRAANLRPLPLRPSPPMPVATENLSTPRPVSHRTPTQRHMHNYSLPSPISMRPTTPRSPTRCQSSPTLSEYRKAVYIAPGFTIDDRNPVFLPRHPPASSLPNSPSKSSTSSIFAAQQADVPPPSLTSSEHNHVSPPLTPDSCSIKRPFTSPRTPTKVKSTRSKGNRLSALSVSSLSFPPISSSTPSYAECDADPFTSAPFSFPSGQEMRSKWSPSSSTISLSQGRDQSAFEKLKGDIPVSTTKLREFFSRLSISRSPTSSTSPFKSTATNRRENRESYRNRPESPMTFVIVDEEKNDPDWLIGSWFRFA